MIQLEPHVIFNLKKVVDFDCEKGDRDLVRIAHTIPQWRWMELTSRLQLTRLERKTILQSEDLRYALGCN